jgi:predicted RNase H-like HicB family nuclease
MHHTIKAFVHKGENYYIAECLEIAVVTQGKTLDETIANLKEAVSLHLEGESTGKAFRPVRSFFAVKVITVTPGTGDDFTLGILLAFLHRYHPLSFRIWQREGVGSDFPTPFSPEGRKPLSVGYLLV